MSIGELVVGGNNGLVLLVVNGECNHLVCRILHGIRICAVKVQIHKTCRELPAVRILEADIVGVDECLVLNVPYGRAEGVA